MVTQLLDHFVLKQHNAFLRGLLTVSVANALLYCLHTLTNAIVFTFCASRRQRKMYCGHARLSVCLSAAVRPHYCTDPDVTWGMVFAIGARVALL